MKHLFKLILSLTFSLLFLIVYFAISTTPVAVSQDQPPPNTYKLNPGARATLNRQVLGVPGYGAISQYGESIVQAADGLVACSSAETSTTKRTILAGASGQSILVSKINCHNNTTVASIITFYNDLASIGSDLIGTTTLGTNRINYPLPQPVLIDGAKTLSFALTTGSTSTICCANYKLYPNLTPTATNTATSTSTATPTLTPTRTATP